jgi:predicted CopG family antitoxin
MQIFKYMFKHKHGMVSKTITITEDAYKAIVKLKREGESFSKLFLRLGKFSPHPSKFRGILPGKEKELLERAKKTRKEMEKDFRRREKNVFT